MTAETLRHVDDLVLVDDGAPPEIAALLDGVRARPPRAASCAWARTTARARPSPPGIARRARARTRRRDRARLRRAASAGADPRASSPRPARRRRDRRSPARRRRCRALRRIAQRASRAGRSASSSAGACATPRTACGCSAPTRCATSRRRPAATRPRPGTSRRSSAAGTTSAGSPMPAIYDGEPSSFRAGRRHAARRCARCFAPSAPRPAPAPASAPRSRDVAREWAPRIGLGMLLAWAVAAALPLLGAARRAAVPRDQRARRRPGVALPGARPAQPQLPAARRGGDAGVLAGTRRLRFAGGALLAMAFAGVFSDLVLEVVQLGVDRPRPEEALGAEVLRSHGRHWSHIPSFPSGHLIVTTALVAAAATMAPLLRPGVRLSRRGRRDADDVRRALPARRRRRHDRRLAGRPVLRRARARGAPPPAARAPQPRLSPPGPSRRSSPRPRDARRSCGPTTQDSPIAMPSAAPASTSSQKWTPR